MIDDFRLLIEDLFEYLVKLFMESKSRHPYIINESSYDDKK